MIAEFESRILALIDNMVDHASDDELFAGGYLRGHLTLGMVVVFDTAFVQARPAFEGIAHGHDNYAQIHGLIVAQIGRAVRYNRDHASPPPMPRNLL